MDSSAPVVEIGEGGDSCCYCRRPDGGPTRKARNALEKNYRINGHIVVFAFRLCELCNYSRTLFPHWDSLCQSVLIKLTVKRMNERFE